MTIQEQHQNSYYKNHEQTRNKNSRYINSKFSVPSSKSTTTAATIEIIKLYKSKIPIYHYQHHHEFSKTSKFRQNTEMASRQNNSEQVEMEAVVANTRIVARKAAAAKMARTQQMQRSKSVNQQQPPLENQPNATLNLSNLSTQSITSSTISTAASSSKASTIDMEKASNLYEFLKMVRKCLKKIEKSYSVDSLYEYIKNNLKYNGYRNFTLDSLGSESTNSYYSNRSASQNATTNRSTSQLRSTPMASMVGNNLPIGFIYDLNGRNVNKKIQPLELLFKNMRIFRKLFTLMQTELLANLLSIKMKSLPNECNFSDESQLPVVTSKEEGKCVDRLSKYHQKLLDLNEKLNILINDQSSCELKLLSSHSALSEKYEFYKHGEYLLRLTPDIVYKMRVILKLSEKSFYLSNSLFVQQQHSRQDPPSLPALTENKPYNINGLKKSLSVQHPMKSQDLNVNDFKIGFIDSPEMSPKPPNTFPEIPKLPQIDLKQKSAVKEMPKVPHDIGMHNKNYSHRDENNNIFEAFDETEDFKNNDSFIQETDCSSLVSEESLVEYEKKGNHDSASELLTIKKRTALLEEYKHIKEKIDSMNRCIQDLGEYLNSLFERAERCRKLHEQLKSDNDLIRKTESNLKFYSNGGRSSNANSMNNLFRLQLHKQLDYLKYRSNLTMQDLNIEQMCSSEISSAIVDTECRMTNLNIYLKDLKKYLSFIELKLSEDKIKFSEEKIQISKKVINNKTANVRHSNKPFASKPKILPPLQQPKYIKNVDQNKERNSN